MKEATETDLLAVSDDSALRGLVPMGDVECVLKQTEGARLHCRGGGVIEVTPIAPDILRLRHSFTGSFEPPGGTGALDEVTRSPVGWSIEESAERVEISTDRLRLLVEKSPLRVTFLDRPSGRVMLRAAGPPLHEAGGRQVALRLELPLEEHILGLGEKAFPFDRRRGKFTMWNRDTPAYEKGTDPIYQSVPFHVGWTHGECYGLYLDNSHRTHFDFGHTTEDTTVVTADGGELDLYYLHGPSLRAVVEGFTSLTGRMPLWPRWALGNQQSRYSYYPDSRVLELIDEYRRRQIPLDVVHLDIHYMQDFRVFTWNRERFPDPSAFVAAARKRGVRIITIVDPGVAIVESAPGYVPDEEHPELESGRDGYHVYAEGSSRRAFLRRRDSHPYIGRVWPGKVHFVDYSRPDASEWWGDLHRGLLDHGVAGIWMDMNEPADFTDQSGGAWRDVISEDHGRNSDHGRMRNLFALGMARATYEGLRRLEPELRPFVITRAGFAGIQRYSTMWTGDNTSTWESLALSIPMFTSLGLSGQPFVGADIGGFIGSCDGELLTRWYQVGFLTPFCRNHKAIGSHDQEPWRFGPRYGAIILSFLELRYRLLPYLYNLVEEAHRTGIPILRPLILDFPDEGSFHAADQYMVGSALLAAPVVERGARARDVYRPDGVWFDFWTGARLPTGHHRAEAPLETTPLYVRGGSILPLGPAMSHVGEKRCDPLSLRIYPDGTGTASLDLYEDDGETEAHRRGEFRRTRFRMGPEANRLYVRWETLASGFAVADRSLHFELPVLSAPGEVLFDGQMLFEGETAPGWSLEESWLIIRVPDLPGSHALEIGSGDDPEEEG